MAVVFASLGQFSATVSALAIGLWSFPVLLVLIFTRMPIGLAMLVTGLMGSVVLNGSTLMVLGQLKHLSYGTFSNHSLSIIPLFLLMGHFATLGGLSTSLFRAAQACVGHRRGGLGMSAVAACAGFGAICGSSLATAATMGQVALPELRRAGYSGALATGTLAAGGTLGILIPPSIILVIYAILTEQNIARLFVAAVVPGLLAAAGYMVCIALYTRLAGSEHVASPRQSGRERRRALLAAWPVLVIFLLVVGGIYLGVFTPTEAAAIGAAATFVVAALNGSLNPAAFRSALLGTASSTGMIFLIILGAGVFNSFLAATQLPQALSTSVAEAAINPYAVLAMMLFFYLLCGCLMDSLSMILLTVPIFFPVISQLDFGMTPQDFALWFGVLVLVVVEVGLITPPVGMNLFVINRLASDVPMSETFRGVLPFVLTDLARVLILVAMPPITLGLVWLMY